VGASASNLKAETLKSGPDGAVNPGKASLSVLIPVRNDAANLRACLETVAFADEIVVIDSESADETEEISRQVGARVVQFAWDGKFPRKKNWALQNVPWRHDWVLIIDADERITPALEGEIRAAVERTDVDGFYLNRRFWFLDGWINHCGYFPSWNLRLFRRRKGRYERMETLDRGAGDNEVHEHILLDGRADYLDAPMEHYAFPDIATFVDKHIRYAAWEASVREQFASGAEGRMRASPFGNALERRRWLKRVSLRMPFRPTLRFIYSYFLKQGFRDGHRGWILCRLLAWYEFLITAKMAETKRAKKAA
jgi:glycosyltransferase involved in cell wall biosynthesis